MFLFIFCFNQPKEEDRGRNEGHRGPTWGNPGDRGAGAPARAERVTWFTNVLISFNEDLAIC